MRFAPQGQDSRFCAICHISRLMISPFLRLTYTETRANHNRKVVPGRWKLIVYAGVDRVTSKLFGLVIALERELDLWWSVCVAPDQGKLNRGWNPSQFAIPSLMDEP